MVLMTDLGFVDAPVENEGGDKVEEVVMGDIQ
jgi:hypothetical protein